MYKKHRLDKKNNLYILNKEDIEIEAEYILYRYFETGLFKSVAIPIDYIIEQMGIDIFYRKISPNGDILGASTFSEGKIEIFDENGVTKGYEIFKSNLIIIDSDLVDKDDIRCNPIKVLELEL